MREPSKRFALARILQSTSMESADVATTHPVPHNAAADLDSILEGLSAEPKRLSPKYFYDERGSELFDRICELPEYYPTRTELALMREHADTIAELVGPRAAVIEFGAGSTAKIRTLLDHLVDPVAYIPVDISADYLAKQAQELSRDYPHLTVRPVVADFTQPFRLPNHRLASNRNLVFFPGSTIGNFSRRQALDLLEVMAFEAKHDGALLIGVDLKKDPETLQAAYNDAAGVTAEFNKNVLVRLNRELGADFSLQNFRHRAVYDDDHGRVEMRLVSLKPQSVHVAGRTLDFAKGEYIVTEHSHKYSVEEFRELARRAGFEPVVTWVDADQLFSVHYLKVQ
ncbi:MAG TPA: L-histidine N(alpha)-methyltransferase [Gammaproteobacteria bacterium]|nr:L-histidine N(alpha)-methyltransferase [Gammaproteobacteria bacterium]